MKPPRLARLFIALFVAGATLLGGQGEAFAAKAKKKSATSKSAKAKTSTKVATPSKAQSARHLEALDLALKGETKSALSILEPLATESMPEAELDRVRLSIGRVHYQAGNYESALASYNQVRRGGPSWLEALEERATAQMRLGRPQEALASLKTVLTPVFEDRINSEPYFVAALAQLRVCDYKSVFNTLDLFKSRYRERVKSWESPRADRKAMVHLSEVRETIQKLNLVEAETIQHLFVSESGRRQSGTPPSIERSRDQLAFPTDNETDAKEVWLDEVDDYRVTTKDCPTLNQAIPLAARESK